MSPGLVRDRGERNEPNAENARRAADCARRTDGFPLVGKHAAVRGGAAATGKRAGEIAAGERATRSVEFSNVISCGEDDAAIAAQKKLRCVVYVEIVYGETTTVFNDSPGVLRFSASSGCR